MSGPVLATIEPTAPPPPDAMTMTEAQLSQMSREVAASIARPGATDGQFQLAGLLIALADAVDTHADVSAEARVVATFKALGNTFHANAKAHGFWDSDRGDAEAIALMHSELSEALEAIRHNNPESDHIPGFTGAEEEFADVIIRILDTCHVRGYRVAEAMIAKHKFNCSRPYKHGKTM
jgi:NTP pyrophosphatase (non-canonical NTP hydrolase)